MQDIGRETLGKKAKVLIGFNSLYFVSSVVFLRWKWLQNSMWQPEHLNNYNFITERRSRVGNTPAYSGGPGFKSWPRDRQSWLSFYVFPQSLQAKTGRVP
jgi:hypothetical protein